MAIARKAKEVSKLEEDLLDESVESAHVEELEQDITERAARVRDALLDGKAALEAAGFVEEQGLTFGVEDVRAIANSLLIEEGKTGRTAFIQSAPRTYAPRSEQPTTPGGTPNTRQGQSLVMFNGKPVTIPAKYATQLEGGIIYDNRGKGYAHEFTIAAGDLRCYGNIAKSKFDNGADYISWQAPRLVKKQ